MATTNNSLSRINEAKHFIEQGLKPTDLTGTVQVKDLDEIRVEMRFEEISRESKRRYFPLDED